MVATPTGEAGQSVTSHAVAGTGSGHVPAPIPYPSMVGSTACIWDPLCSRTCATRGLVHVSTSVDYWRYLEVYLKGFITIEQYGFEARKSS